MSTLIDNLLNGTDEEIKAAKIPHVKTKIKRLFDSAIEDAEEQKLDAEIALNDLRRKLVQYHKNGAEYLNEIIDNKNIIDAATATIKYLKQEKSEMFKEVK
jgi:hypothetical protein